MSARRRLAFVSGLVACVAACDSQPRAERTTSDPAGPSSAPPELTRENALDSARAFMARSSAAQHVFLDSTAIEAVDTLWRVTFLRRRQFIIPNVVTVDVNARTGAMRFPGDE
jgi:hypothetical protein